MTGNEAFGRVRKRKKQAIFQRCRESLATAGLSPADPPAIICPLCWTEAPLDRLTLEHIVPESIGGKRRVLTCDRCNNGGGSDLDRHLKAYQHMQDALKGQAWLRTGMNIHGARVAVDLKIDEKGKEFRIIGKTSNPADVEQTKVDFVASRVLAFNVSLPYGYICHLRVDKSYADAAHSACSVQRTLNSTASDEYCLELINVPWNTDLENLVAEVGGTLTGDDSRKVLRLSGTARNYRQIKHLAKAVRAVTGRGQQYLNSNWKWSTRKTAEALDRLAECLLAAYRLRKSR